MFNFKWKDVPRMQYELLAYQGRNNAKDTKPLLSCKLVNHFEFVKELDNKKSLYINMKNYLESQKSNVFEQMPVTFVIENYHKDLTS